MANEKKERFVMVHYDVIDAMDKMCEENKKINKATCCFLYSILLKHANTKTNKCFPSYKTLMEETGIKDRHTLLKYLNILADGGFIYINSGREHVANNYYFPMESWFEMPDVLERRHGDFVEDDKETAFRKEMNKIEKRHEEEQKADEVFELTTQGQYDKLCDNVTVIRKYYEKLSKKSDAKIDEIRKNCDIDIDSAVRNCDLALFLLKPLAKGREDKASGFIRQSIDRIERQGA